MTMTTSERVQDAIETSIRENRIVHLVPDSKAELDALREEVSMRCDDSSGDECWGEENGRTWRITVDAYTGRPYADETLLDV